jgi:hypothetical protein
MDTPEESKEDTHIESIVTPSSATVKSLPDGASLITRSVKHWASEHIGEISWALVFAVLAGYAFALYLEEHKPYIIYVVYDPDTDKETKDSFELHRTRDKFAEIGDVKIQIQLEMLPDQDLATAAGDAEKLARLPGTLLVIEHTRSQKITSSVKNYFSVRPQIPLITTEATDDNLLGPCENPAAEGLGSTSEVVRGPCYDGSWFNSLSNRSEPFAPLLQLSPTNDVQARSAVQFAIDRGRHRFLVVLGNDVKDRDYTDKMGLAYSNAISAANALSVLPGRAGVLLEESALQSSRPDCVLYAGSLGEATTLFNRLSTMKPNKEGLMVIFSDSVIQTRTTDKDLAGFKPPPIATAQMQLQRSVNPVNFTYPADANDYNVHKNPYVDDAFSIASQLVDDLDHRGGDIRLRVKSFFHVQTAADVRRNLNRIMRENFNSRTWFPDASKGTPYVFNGNKQFGGIFHVWQIGSTSTPENHMEDVDRWHIPRSKSGGQDSQGK